MWPVYSKYRSFVSILFLSLIVLHIGCIQRSADTEGGAGERLLGPGALRLTPGNVDASDPHVAADDSGNLYVVYVEHQDTRNGDIKLLRLDSKGTRTSEPIVVNPDPGDAKVWAGDPPRIVVRGQNVYIGWTRKFRDVAARGNDLVLSVSRDSGITFEPPVRVNDDVEPASHGMHSLAVDESGDVIMLWLDERSLARRSAPMTGGHNMAEPNAEAYYAVSKDGGRSFSTNKRIAADVCPCCKTALLIDQDNTIYAAWRQVLGGEHRHILVARSDDGGETFNKNVIVSDDKWQINACPVSGAALLSARPGTLDVLWYTAGDAGQAGLYFARSTDNGNSFAPRIMLSNEAKAGTPSAIVDGDQETVVFSTRDNRVILASWTDSPLSQTTRTSVPDSLLPSVIRAAERTKVIFVRTVDAKRSVWMQ